jgi:hypothetical protein
LEVRGPDEFDGAFEAARRQNPDALITVEDPLTVNYRKLIADFAAGQQLPALHKLREFVLAGGLMSYGASLADVFRRAAVRDLERLTRETDRIVIDEAQRRWIMRALTNAMADDRRSTRKGGALSRPTQDEAYSPVRHA